MIENQKNENDVDPESLNQPGRKESHRLRKDSSWIPGAILILLGFFFLLQNQGILFFKNWWALFILIPALSSFQDGWQHYREAGYLTVNARNSFFIGVLLTLVSVIFLFELSWTWLGPILLILLGLGILVNALFTKDQG